MTPIATSSARTAHPTGINQRRYGSNAWRTRSIASWSGVRNRVVGAMRRTINRLTYSTAKNTAPNAAPSSSLVRSSVQNTDV